LVFYNRRRNPAKRGLLSRIWGREHRALSTSFPAGNARVNIVWITSCLGRRRPLRKCLCLALVAGDLCLAGCANPGPPQPPSLNLPSIVKDLRADRIGNEVRLVWTTPSDTTDGVLIKPPIVAELCRDLPPPGAAPATCTSIRRLPVQPGPSSIADPLPARLLSDPVRPLLYRVRLLNASDRAAGLSNSAVAAAGCAPEGIENLRSSASAGGTRILWQPQISPAAAVVLDRSTLASAPSPAQPATVAKPGTAASLTGKRSTASVPVRLEGALQGPDPGGTLDLSSHRDTTYSYVAWRARSVTLEGKLLILRSPVSSPLVVTVRDTTPPATPSGLEAVVDGSAVDLSWEPDTEPDLAGYFVERTELPPANPGTADAPSWRRLNQAPSLAPAFRDTPPASLGSYRYRILAADTTGNISLPTISVSVTVHPSAVP